MPRAMRWGAVAVGAAALAWWRRRDRARERVDLHFEDGSMVSFDAASDVAERLVPLARELVAVARP
ncbi:MAG: hypothetical protein ICV74_03020 [Thermoleophilia bacterium]|nr:hypothetical protein [Thermoleophilia bacterium]